MKPKLFCLLAASLIVISGCSIPVIQSTPPAAHLDNRVIYALPKGMIRLSLQNVANQDVFTCEPVFIPDPSHYYALELCSHGGYDDEVQVTVDSNGLLKAINVTTTSQAGAILTELVETAKQAAKIATLRTAKKYFDIWIDPADLPRDNAGVVEKSVEIRKLVAQKESKEAELDTAKKNVDKAKTAAEKKKSADLIENYKKELAEITKKISDKEKELNTTEATAHYSKDAIRRLKQYAEYDIRYISLDLQPNNITGQAPVQTGAGAARKSIYYRPLLPYKLKVMFKDNLYEKIVFLPYQAPIIAWDITRPAFVKQVTKLTFVNGVLTEVYLNKPSEWLAAVKIPSEILKAVAGLPLELLQFRVSNDQSYNNLLSAQIQQIQLQQQLLQLKQQGQ
jgi:hypothetical protein